MRGTYTPKTMLITSQITYLAVAKGAQPTIFPVKIDMNKKNTVLDAPFVAPQIIIVENGVHRGRAGNLTATAWSRDFHIQGSLIRRSTVDMVTSVSQNVFLL